MGIEKSSQSGYCARCLAGLNFDDREHFLGGRSVVGVITFQFDRTLRFAERIWFVADSSIHLRNRGVDSTLRPAAFLNGR